MLRGESVCSRDGCSIQQRFRNSVSGPKLQFSSEPRVKSGAASLPLILLQLAVDRHRAHLANWAWRRPSPRQAPSPGLVRMQAKGAHAAYVDASLTASSARTSRRLRVGARRSSLLPRRFALQIHVFAPCCSTSVSAAARAQPAADAGCAWAVWHRAAQAQLGPRHVAGHVQERLARPVAA